jgi:hypothetical protein
MRHLFRHTNNYSKGEGYLMQGAIQERERILNLIQATTTHMKDDCVRCNIIKEITKGTWFTGEKGQQ